MIPKSEFLTHTRPVSEPFDPESPDPFFALAKQFPFFARTSPRRKLAAKLDSLLGLTGLSAMLSHIPLGHRNPYRAGREFMECEIEGREAFEKLIPKSGPTLVVANHSYGALDAIVASELTLNSRPDTLVFGNSVMAHPVHKEWYLPVEILDDSPSAHRRNLDSMRRALAHLKAGGCVLIFPAGEVERWRWDQLRIEEGLWSTHLARLARKSQATISPLAFPEGNPLWFHLPGALHPFLRLLALPRAFLSLRGTTVPVKAAPPIPYHQLPSDPEEFTNAVRKVVLRLANRESDGDRK